MRPQKNTMIQGNSLHCMPLNGLEPRKEEIYIVISSLGIPIVPDLPVSYIEANRETELWKWLDEITHNGSTVLAIPHNSNASKGMMFDENMPNGDLSKVKIRA